MIEVGVAVLVLVGIFSLFRDILAGFLGPFWKQLLLKYGKKRVEKIVGAIVIGPLVAFGFGACLYGLLSR